MRWPWTMENLVRNRGKITKKRLNLASFLIWTKRKNGAILAQYLDTKTKMYEFGEICIRKSVW